MSRAVILSLVLLVPSLTGCSDPATPEARIRATLEAMEEAAEAGKRGAFMGHVADDFGGPAGLDRQGLADLFRVQLLVHTRIGALLSKLDIEVFGDRATADFHALLTGGARTWFPESGRVYVIETGWRRDGDDWLLISADWHPLLGG